MDTIICTFCKKEKPRSEFSSDRMKRNGKKSNCNECKNRMTREYRKSKIGNREWVKKTNAYQREYLKNNPDKAVNYRKARTREQHIRYMLKQNYGMSLEDYNGMVDKQGGVCKICGNVDVKFSKTGESRIQRLAVDHCHKTGEVRGLLCSSCNGGLGLFKDDINLLRKALKYLTKDCKN
jgi:hypothetical protein